MLFRSSVLMAEGTGEITITFNPSTVGVAAAENTLVLAPYVRTGAAGTAITLQAAQTAGSSGSIDWGCASATQTSATAAGMTNITAGTLQARYAPASCR